MDQFLRTLPKSILAFVAILAGFLVIVAKNPPRNECDSQMDLFQESQKDFLYVNTEGKIAKPSQAKTYYEFCQAGNSPGACFDLFTKLRKLNLDMTNIPNHCGKEASDDESLQKWTLTSLKLMVQIAWGSAGPMSFTQRYAWLDASDVALFCGLRKNAERLFGTETYTQWREGVMTSLPGAAKLGREQLWAKSLFSTNCDDLR